MKEFHNESNLLRYGEKVYRVVEDGVLLRWAARRSIDPSQAQKQALQEGFVPHRYLKNFSAISLEEQIKICESKILVAGCGGLGGVIISLLARLGVGWLRIIDRDVFASSNLNRQWFCTATDLGRPKARVARQTVSRINPLVRVEAVTKMLTEETTEGLLDQMNLAMDALDNLPTRHFLACSARRAGIPFIHGAVSGWWGQVSTFPPDSPFRMQDIYGDRTSRDPEEDAMGVLGPAVSFVGSLQVFEALRILLGKPPAYAGRLAYFDGETGILEHIPLKREEPT